MSASCRAFISYSQQDKTFGKRIHTWLETNRVPKGVSIHGDLSDRCLRGFFFNEEEMPAASDIAGKVRMAMSGGAT